MLSGGPNRLASSSSSRVTSVGSSTRMRLRALVLPQEIVERLAQQDRLLLLLALGQPLEPSELRGGVIGGLEHHVVAGREADGVATLLLRREQRQVRLAHELLRRRRAARLRVAWRVRDADAHSAPLTVRHGLRQCRVELLTELFRAQEDRLQQSAGRQQSELVAADAAERPAFLRRGLRKRRDGRADGLVASLAPELLVQPEEVVEIEMHQRRERLSLEGRGHRAFERGP